MEKTIVLVTTDAENLHVVDITGAMTPAFIRERIFSKVCISFPCRQPNILRCNRLVQTSSKSQTKTRRSFPFTAPRSANLPLARLLPTRSYLAFTSIGEIILVTSSCWFRTHQPLSTNHPMTSYRYRPSTPSLPLSFRHRLTSPSALTRETGYDTAASRRLVSIMAKVTRPPFRTTILEIRTHPPAIAQLYTVVHYPLQGSGRHLPSDTIVLGPQAISSPPNGPLLAAQKAIPIVRNRTRPLSRLRPHLARRPKLPALRTSRYPRRECLPILIVPPSWARRMSVNVRVRMMASPQDNGVLERTGRIRIVGGEMPRRIAASMVARRLSLIRG